MFEVTSPGQTNYLCKLCAGIIQVLVQSACQACSRNSAAKATHVGVQCDVTVVGNSFPRSRLSLTACRSGWKSAQASNLGGGKDDDARLVLAIARQTLLQQAFEVSAICDKHSATSRPQRQGPATLTKTDERLHFRSS